MKGMVIEIKPYHAKNTLMNEALLERYQYPKKPDQKI